MRRTAQNQYLYLLAALPPLFSIYFPHVIAHPLLRHSTGLLYSFVFLPLVECVTGPPHLLDRLRRPSASHLSTGASRTPSADGGEGTWSKLPAAARREKNGKPTTFRDLPVFRLALFLALFTVTLTLLHALACVSAASAAAPSALQTVLARAAPRTAAQTALSVLSLAYVVLTGYAAAHELLHKAGRESRLERLLALLFLSFVLNPAYFVDHHHHHQYVGTDRDGASARRGESVYAFTLRMERGAWTRALRASRCALRASAGPAAFLRRDRFARGLMVSLACVVAARVALGAAAAAFYVALAAVGVFIMDCANYMQHYGLRRSVDPVTGALEPVAPWHSWDCSNVLSNVVTFSVGAHADHHMDGAVAYPALVHGRGPEYPLGMHCMTWISLCPPLFRSIAHPIIDDIERAKAKRAKAH